jgi:hypothetical protein
MSSRGEVVRREAGAAALTAVGVVVVGLLAGVVWLMVAPRPVYVLAAGEAVLDPFTSHAYFDADGRFAVVALVAGAICGAVAFALFRGRGIGALIGLTVGGALAAVVAWRLGHWLGPDPVVDQIGHLAEGARVEAPLNISARGVLLLWPMASVLVFFALTAGLTRRDENAKQELGEGGAAPVSPDDGSEQSPPASG